VSPSATIVNANYIKVTIPSTSPASLRYEVAPGCRVVPLNALPSLQGGGETPGSYVVVGAGKTGVDAILWLLNVGHVSPDNIMWVMPRDPWFFRREFLARDMASRPVVFDWVQLLIGGSAPPPCNADEYCLASERAGLLSRLDTTRMPQQFKGSTVSESELEVLRKIPTANIIRKGHILRAENSRIVLQKGVFDLPAHKGHTLYVDCSAGGLPFQPTVPVFQEGGGTTTIVLQQLDFLQVVFSAALIAKVETMALNIKEKNALARPVPYPEVPRDFLSCMASCMRNNQAWKANSQLLSWLKSARLCGNEGLGPHAPPLWTTLRFVLADPLRRVPLFMAAVAGKVESGAIALDAAMPRDAMEVEKRKAKL